MAVVSAGAVAGAEDGAEVEVAVTEAVRYAELRAEAGIAVKLLIL